MFGAWLNIEDKRRRFPVLNLPESKISQLTEKYGDLAKVSQTRQFGDDDESLTVGLLDGQQTPTLYDVSADTVLESADVQSLWCHFVGGGVERIRVSLLVRRCREFVVSISQVVS